MSTLTSPSIGADPAIVRTFIEEYFEAIESGRPYYGEAGPPIAAEEITDCAAFSS